jgi:hypothetical protein
MLFPTCRLQVIRLVHIPAPHAYVAHLPIDVCYKNAKNPVGVRPSSVDPPLLAIEWLVSLPTIVYSP